MHRVIAFIHLLDSGRTNMIADRHIKSAITAGLGIALTFGISISHPAQALATQIDSINQILSSRRLPPVLIMTRLFPSMLVKVGFR